MRTVIFIAIFCSTFFFKAVGQDLYIGEKNTANLSAADTIGNFIYVFFNNYYKKINVKELTIDSLKLYKSKDFNFNNYEPVFNNSKLYFIHKDGGLVYEMINDSIKRIDKSFNHKMQSGSNIFVYNSKIHRFGGYGFWSARNFYTLFDEDLKEWDVSIVKNSEKFPKPSFTNFLVLHNDDFYIFNGKSINQKWLLNNYFNKEVWKYSLKNNSWTYLGKSRKEFSYLNFIHYKTALLIFFPEEIVLINPVTNSMISFARDNSTFNLTAKVKSFFFNNKFYLFNEKENHIHFSVADENKLFINKISEEPYYTNYNYLKIVIIVIILLIVFGFGIKFLIHQTKERNKILLLDNGLRFKNKFTEFDPKAMAIIKTLLLNGETNSNSILGIVEESQYSVAHNERIKVQKIEEINFKIKTLLSITTDVINSKKSKLDRRIRVYTIKRDLFFKRNL